MKESFWGVFIVTLGIISVSFILFFQTLTNTDEQNYILLKEITEAAMYDAVNLAEYRSSGNVCIYREKFVENFIRRFAESASLANDYEIRIYDVNECPPKVSIEVKTKKISNIMNFSKSEVIDFDIVNRLDAILETPY